MNLESYIKWIEEKFRRRKESDTSTQNAYQTLQKGVRRYQEENRLLSKRELDIVQAFRDKMVLNAPERELIEKSEEAISRRSRSGWHIAIFGFSVLLLGIAIKVLWPFSNTVSADSTTLAVSSDSDEPSKTVPVKKINRPPGIQTSNLPIRKERMKNLREEAEEEAPSKIAQEQEGTPSPIVLPGTSFENSSPKPELAQPPQQQNRTAEVKTEKEGAEESAELEPQVKENKKEPSYSVQETIQTASGKILIVQDRGRWGLANPAGRYLLEPEYDLIKAFRPEEGLFLIERGGKQGIAQASGKIILHPFFDHIKTYHLQESLLVVANNGKFGVYDEKKQEFAIGLQFKDICCFAEGLFGFQMNDGKWGFIDRSGEKVIPAIYDAIESNFEDGRALVKKGDKKYYIDKSGNVFPYKGES